MSWKEKGSVFFEEIEVAVDGVSERIKELVSEGNVRRLIIRKENGDKLLEIPLTAGVAVGGALTVMWPLVAALIAMTGLVSKVKIQVIRNDFEE